MLKSVAAGAAQSHSLFVLHAIANRLSTLSVLQERAGGSTDSLLAALACHGAAATWDHHLQDIVRK